MTRAPGSFRRGDGRWVHVYADGCHGSPPRDLAESSAPTTAGTRSRLRWDAVAEEWVVMAAHRSRRPFHAESLCPLCPAPASEEWETEECEIPGGEYDVAVFDNRYPAFAGLPLRTPVPGAPGLLTDAPAAGACEVVSFDSGHTRTLAELPLRRLRTVIGAWADRTLFLNDRQDIAQVVCFENHGAEVGASLSHPHGQIYGYPFPPSRFRQMREAARRVRDARGTCVFCDIVAAESAAGERVVVAGRRWIAIVPFAARWPFEVHLFARRHLPDLPALDEEERAELAVVYRSVLRRFAAVGENPLPYMAVWVQAPARQDRELSHLHVQIFSDRGATGRVKRLAAGELGTGAWVSEADPEQAAAALRKADPSWRQPDGVRTAGDGSRQRGGHHVGQ
ncbi:galactose-1-phosphate uridylyltransferase [Streptomyces sp. NPDC020898]|uniref:galactose-1-phosphate uridylyltransferase n=1 Tax=Streptomyces sp. NPDC020898 TaxID=3365101 RepID=UPI00379C9608